MLRYTPSAPMQLADILDIGRVTTSLSAADKSEVLRALAEMFSGQDADEVYRVFQEREALASTGVGSGVAIPHGRLPTVDRPLAALGICRSGVDFDAIDGQPAHIFVALLSPEHHPGDHIKALARISRLLRTDLIREQLLGAVDASGALSVILEEEARLG